MVIQPAPRCTTVTLRAVLFWTLWWWWCPDKQLWKALILTRVITGSDFTLVLQREEHLYFPVSQEIYNKCWHRVSLCSFCSLFLNNAARRWCLAKRLICSRSWQQMGALKIIYKLVESFETAIKDWICIEFGETTELCGVIQIVVIWFSKLHIVKVNFIHSSSKYKTYRESKCHFPLIHK